MYREILPEELKVDKTLKYVYFIDRTHPLASKNVGRVYYHRHVASISIGRWLSKDESVHHKDGNKQNNVTSNLEVMTFSDHALLHALKNGYSEKVELVCPVCTAKFKVHACSIDIRVHCSEVCAKQASIKWLISKEDLELLIWNMSYVDISTKYNISDVGAKKRAKSLGCRMPPPYFHNKTASFRKEQREIHNIPDLPTQ